MTIYVDQSGKVESTKKSTVIAFSNGKSKTLIINQREKRKLIAAIREFKNPKKEFIFQIFAALVFLLIRKENVDNIIIDREYPGKEPVIKNILCQLFRKYKLPVPNISCMEVGKKCGAHKAGIAVYREETSADERVSALDVLRVLY